MGAMARRKGQAGERELAAVLSAMGLPSHRTGQTVGIDGVPDVQTIPGVHIECKRTEAIRIHDAMSQARCDAMAGTIPVVCHRRNHDRWLLTVALADLPGFRTDRGPCAQRNGGGVSLATHPEPVRTPIRHGAGRLKQAENERCLKPTLVPKLPDAVPPEGGNAASNCGRDDTSARC